MFHPREREMHLVVGEDDVALLDQRNEVWRFRWEEVTRIETYKRDIFSMDLICLDFFVESRQLTFKTHEDMKGFPALRERIHARFPCIREGWWQKVAFPAFASNHQVLYDKK